MFNDIAITKACHGQSFGLLGFIQPIGEVSTDFEMRKQVIIQELKALFAIPFTYNHTLMTAFSLREQRPHHRTPAIWKGQWARLIEP